MHSTEKLGQILDQITSQIQSLEQVGPLEIMAAAAIPMIREMLGNVRPGDLDRYLTLTAGVFAAARSDGAARIYADGETVWQWADSGFHRVTFPSPASWPEWLRQVLCGNPADQQLPPAGGDLRPERLVDDSPARLAHDV